jgi:hypothetical protein
VTLLLALLAYIVVGALVTVLIVCTDPHPSPPLRPYELVELATAGVLLWPVWFVYWLAHGVV